ncbi:hypothetical protein SCLCIDRAFT_140955, partial [Scleroderma citrinum Foug A]
QKDSKPLVENQFSAFLNTLAVTVLQHLNKHDHAAGTNFGAAVVGIIHMFTHANRELLGFDLTIDVNHGVPSIPKQPGPIFNFISTVQGAGSQIYCIFELLWASAGFIRRGTVSYHVRPEVTGPSKASEGLLDDYDYILKDNWVNQAQVDHEPNILKHIAGIEGVPVLVDLWAVQFEEKEDMMLRYRPAGWIPPTLFVNHVHRRQLMHPVGSPITSFQSQKELLFGLIHRLETHEHLVTLKHVLHCDVSPNNLVFKQAPPGTLHTLYLIDFDYAIRLQPIDGEVTNYPKGTGTLPFALLQVLQWAEGGRNNSGVTHTVADDLESFFYVFMWLCILYDGREGSSNRESLDNGFIVHAWGEGGMGPGGVTLVLNAKIRFLYSPGNSIIDTQFTPYFNNLKPLAKEWKQLVKLEDERREAKCSTSMYTHKDVIALLHKYADNLPDFGSLSCPVPLNNHHRNLLI